MKFTLLETVPYSAIPARLPTELRGPLPPAQSHVYTVMIFPPGQVIHSGLASKAVRRLPTDGGLPILAVGTTFTVEAQQVLQNASIFLVERKPWHWTDQSHEEIKVLIRSKVKSPDHR
jgi:hypothetical protein